MISSTKKDGLKEPFLQLRKPDCTTQLPLPKLITSPLPAHTHSAKQTEEVSENLSENDAVPIKVAEFAGKYYIIDGHMIVEARKKRKWKTVLCNIYRVKSKHQIVILHLCSNLSSSPNPINMIRMIEYMRKQNYTAKQIIEDLKATNFVNDILKLTINPDALDVLEQISQFISMHHQYTHHYFPLQLLTWVLRQSHDSQLSAALTLQQIVAETIPGKEHRFIWPTAVEVHMRQGAESNNDDLLQRLPLYSSAMRGNGRPDDARPIIVKSAPDDSELHDMGYDRKHHTRKQYTFKCPHGSLMYINEKSRLYVIEPQKNEGITKLRPVSLETGVFMIPESSRTFLNPKNGTIHIKNCTRSQLKALINKLDQEDINVCVLSSHKL